MQTARDFMETDVTMIPHMATVDRAIQLLLGGAVECAPVVDDRGRFLGVVSEAQLQVVFYDDDVRDERITTFLTEEEAVSVGADMPLAEVGKRLNRSGAQRLAVLENGRLVGMISRTDLLRHIPAAPAESRLALAGRAAW